MNETWRRESLDLLPGGRRNETEAGPFKERESKHKAVEKRGG